MPLEGRASPQSMRNIVDLPAPFGPRSAVTPGTDVEADVRDGDERAEPLRDPVGDDAWLRPRSPETLDPPVPEPAHEEAPAAIAAPSPPTTTHVASASTGALSSGCSPKIRYARSAATNGRLNRSSSFGAPVLSIALRTTLTGTDSASTTPTAAAARRVVKLETAIASDA